LKNQFDKLPEGKKPIFLIGSGNYYVHGKLCQNQEYVFYPIQNNYLSSDKETLEIGSYLVYLDVWERHISFVEDESDFVPGIREIALGKADTATRSKLIWQIKVKPIAKLDNGEEVKGFINKIKEKPEELRKIIKGGTQGETRNEVKPGTGLLKAQANKPAGADASTPCTISPESRYRGTENQLYRVEIHQSGNADTATFKWSRENGSVIFPVQQVGDKTITLGHLGWDDRFSLKAGDWVELVDDNYDLLGLAKPLCQVDSTIDPMEMTVPLKNGFSHSVSEQSHRLLRRWDQRENSNIELVGGTISVKEGKWIELENGVEICFSRSQSDPHNFYATGDYWLIPARTATGDVEWPKDHQLDPIPVPPHGVEHHYAPLSIISVDDSGVVSVAGGGDCRCQFPNLCSVTPS